MKVCCSVDSLLLEPVSSLPSSLRPLSVLLTLPEKNKCWCNWGSGISRWQGARFTIERSRVRVPAGAAGRFSAPGSTFCADSYFGIRSTPRVITVALQMSRSFWQKCMWQVPTEHTCTLNINGCMASAYSVFAGSSMEKEREFSSGNVLTVTTNCWIWQSGSWG